MSYNEADVVQPLLPLVKMNSLPKVHCKIKRPSSCFYISNQNDTFRASLENAHCASSLENLISKKARMENLFKSFLKLSKNDLDSNSSLFGINPTEHGDKKENYRSACKNNFIYNKLQKPNPVRPNLQRKTSSLSLQSEDMASIVKYTGLRKCETVLALPNIDYFEPIQPMNRLRHSFPMSNLSCCACSSHASFKTSERRNSFQSSKNKIKSSGVSTMTFKQKGKDGCIICKLCLEVASLTTRIIECGCVFCDECLKSYVEFEITHGAYEISCPDADCFSQGIFSLEEIKLLGTAKSVKKFERFRLDHEIDLDVKRTWCPRAGCETICSIGSFTSTLSHTKVFSEGNLFENSIHCPTCNERFCSICMKSFHPGYSCEDSFINIKNANNDASILFENGLIKNCPMCSVLIEKDDGCAQMMCKRCKHVFCWYCLASLDDDFLLRHYDRGPCKNKLGHSRASVVWHRVQVIGIFAGFGVLLLAASPLLLLAAPCIICCKCKVCIGSKKGDDTGIDY